MKVLKVIPIKKPLDAEVAIPGSKSYTNRALLMAALSGNTVRIKNPLISEDTEAMIGCLRELGIACTLEDGLVTVAGGIDLVSDREYNLDANLSGTTIRFISALSALVPGTKTIHGKPRLNERPIYDLVDALRQLGASIEYLDREGYPPIRISSSELSAGVVKMKGEVSSQFLSALLMVAPRIGDVEIHIEGEQISKPYVDMTIDAMKQCGVTVVNDQYAKYRITAGAKYKMTEYVVEGDVSSASYFAAIAALTGSRITLKNMNPQSVQADMGFLTILAGMGNEITNGENEITIQGRGVRAVDVDMRGCPDQVQTLAVLSAFVSGITSISGVRSLRVKETERVAALERELAKMGVQAESTPDTLTIHGRAPRPAVIDTYWDHRMAMAFTVAGTKLEGMEIRNPDVVGKTFPDFWEKLNSIGIKTEISEREPNIVLIGMRGSGKTTIAKMLSTRLQRTSIEIDDEVVKKTGMSIADIFAHHGAEYFRNKESEVVDEMLAKENTIISTGGGTILRPHNIEQLKYNAICFWLRAPVEALVERMESDPSSSQQRPTLTDKETPEEETAEVLRQREALYQKAADEVVDTQNKNPGGIVEEVLLKLKARGIHVQ